MPRAFIVARRLRSGKVSYHVRYKPRGNTTPIHWGAFPTKKLAERARDYVNGELAVGRYPDPHAIEPPPERVTVSGAVAAWTESFPTPTAAQQKINGQTLAAVKKSPVASVLVDQMAAADVQRLVHAWAEIYAPATIRQYLSRTRTALEMHGAAIEWRHIRLPLPDDTDHVDPPSWESFQRITAAISPRHLPALLFIERHGLRTVEVAGLSVGDIDIMGRRIRVRVSKGRTGGQRFVPLVGSWAEWLHNVHMPPMEDRVSGAPLFPGFNRNTFRGAVARACRIAKVGEYPPHQYRHRYITLMLLAGVDPAIVSKIAGHRKRSITLDVYGHVLLDEPQHRLDELRAGASWVSGLVDPGQVTDETPELMGLI